MADAEPGPSNENQDESTEEDPSSEKRRVTFSSRLSRRSTIIPADKPRTSFLYERRRSSAVGTAGYVTQLVEDLERDEPDSPFEEKARKPIRKQSIVERRSSIKELEADIGYYMKSVARMSIDESARSVERLPTISREKLQEIKAMSEAKVSETSLSYEWLPSELLDTKPGDRIERSWVGTFVVGKDYWDATEVDGIVKEVRQIKYKWDEDKKPWYDIPLEETSFKKEATFLRLKSKSLDKIDALKDEMDSDFHLKRQERMISAAEAREKPTIFDEWTDNFKMNFQEVARGFVKTKKYSHEGSHISMTNADKWLEKAGILDHVKLTLIDTGYCFLASGGGRNRGLPFSEFTHFLELISIFTGIPLRDITKRLEVCLRIMPSKESTSI